MCSFPEIDLEDEWGGGMGYSLEKWVPSNVL